eukprot:m.510611 g.510611  ORF g.510611 m.510611 type:complete len:201 (+) comp57419_c0_seq8:1740-2342(+)
MSSSNENIAPQTLRLVARELSHLACNPPDGIKVHVNEEDFTDIQATIFGPAGTPYEGGAFRIKIGLSDDFPAQPPKGFFLTKIFHPNVSKTGEICVNTLKKDWKPELGMQHVLTVIKCLLIYPNPESALNEEAGKLLLERYDDYAKHARMMTEIHAKVQRDATDETEDTTKGADKSTAASSTAPAAAKKKIAEKKSLKRL